MTTSALGDRWRAARQALDEAKRDLGRRRRDVRRKAADLAAIEDEARRIGVALVISHNEDR
jgi:hypothetical protein